MKFKYFLRGLGTGIIFAAIIFFAASQGSEKKVLSDDEIKKRAYELGMVEKDNTIKNLLSAENSEKQTKEEKTTEEITTEKKAKEENTTEETTEKKAKEKKTTEKQTAEKKTTEKATTEKKLTEEKNTEDKNKEKIIKFKIERGENSYPVCLRLKELGLVDNAEEFDTYLVEHGYANRLRVGEYKLKMGMDYHSVAEAISDPLED